MGAYVDGVLAADQSGCGHADPAAVAYLVRFDTEHARAVLAHGREQASRRCGGISFGMIAARGNGPALEETAIAALSDNGNNHWDLISYLARYGTPAARKPLEDRLQRFFTEMPDSGTEDGIEESRYDRSPEVMARMAWIGLGQALLQAVLDPQKWMPTPEESAAVLAQCHMPQVCQVAQQQAAQPERHQMILSENGLGEPVYNLAPFPGQTFAELAAKLKQLPANSSILLAPSTPDTADTYNKAAEAIEAAHLHMFQQ